MTGTLTGLTVTYVTPEGFFVFDGSTTRGMEIRVGATWPYAKPKAYDVVSLTVTMLGATNRQAQVLGSADLEVTGQAGTRGELSLSSLAQADFGEPYESRCFSDSQIGLASFDGHDGFLVLPKGGEIPVHFEGDTPTCLGGWIEVMQSALVRDGDVYRIELRQMPDDLGKYDITACPQ